MKLLVPAILVLALIGTASAATVSGTDEGTITQLPGSASDFYLFGNGAGTTASVLTDFTVSTLGNNAYPGTNDGGYSAIETPGGTTVQTGLDYQYAPYDNPTNDPINLATFTIGSSTTFNYSDFNVFVLYSNADVENENTRLTNIFLGLGSDAVGGSGTEVSVSDINSSNTQARVVEFTVTGFTGTEITIGAEDLSHDATGIGGVSFESAPEPSTYVMMIGGLALLGFCVRRKLA